MFSSQNITLLYIEDNAEIRDNLSEYLRKNGFTVIEADDLLSAYDQYYAHKIDIAMVDLQLAGQNGMEFVQYLRERENNLPIIITTAHTDKKFLLDAITYDVTRYLVKPFKKTDLLDALQVAVKKIISFSVNAPTQLHHGYRYDPVNKSVSASDGSTVQLTKKEYLLLELLLSHQNQIVTYEMIESNVWKNMPMSIDALRTLIRGMRKKLYQEIIINLNGTGYKIEL